MTLGTSKQSFPLKFFSWSEQDGQYTSCSGIVPSHSCAFRSRRLTYGIFLGGGSHGYAGMQFTKPARELHNEILCATRSRIFQVPMSLFHHKKKNERPLSCHDLAISFICRGRQQRENCRIYPCENVKPFNHIRNPDSVHPDTAMLETGKRKCMRERSLMGTSPRYRFYARIAGWG